MLMNTGKDIVTSTHGLLTTVAFQLGPQSECHYALEGSVAAAGASVSWLVNNVQLATSPAEVSSIADTVKDNGGMQTPLYTIYM